MKKVILVLVMILAFSCSSDDDSVSNDFAGQWAGTYSGDDNGTWRVNVTSTGIVSGVTTKDNGVEFEVIGSVDNNGSLTAALGSTDSGSEFVGVLDREGNCSGTWTNVSVTPNYFGSWVGSRQ